MIFNGNDFVISYKECGDKNNQPIIIFPPGIGFSSRFEDLAQKLAPNYYVITPDMPGVGDSVTNRGDIEEIGFHYAEFLEGLSLNNPIVIGYCHGGSIAISLSKRKPLKKLILMGTGTYFNILQRVVLTILFAPTLVSSTARMLYAKILTKYSHFKFHNFSDKGLKLVNERWMQTIWYNVPLSVEIEAPTLLIHSDNDKVCRKDSRKDLKRLYPNSTEVIFTCTHDNYINELKEKAYSDILSFLES